MIKFRELNKSVMDREESKEVCKTYATTMASLQEYENQKFEEWGRDIDVSSQAKLKLPLLRRDVHTRMLSVNFDPGLVRLLREVKYFLLLDIKVPNSALIIYKKAEIFRQQTGNLDLIVDMYNHMLTSLLPVETPLFKSHFEGIDKMLSRVVGPQGMDWLSTSINEFITECMEAVKYTSEVLRTLKSNMNETIETLDSWAKPIMERKPKPAVLDDFERALKGMQKDGAQMIKDGGHHIHHLLKDSNGVLKVSAGHPDWKAYVDFLNDIVAGGIAGACRVSLGYLLEQVDPEIIQKENKTPMLEIALTLQGGDVKFKPEIEQTEGKKGSIRDAVNGWIDSFFSICNPMKRLDTPEGSFMRELHMDDHCCVCWLRSTRPFHKPKMNAGRSANSTKLTPICGRWIWRKSSRFFCKRPS